MSNPSRSADRRPFWCGGTGRAPVAGHAAVGTTAEDRGRYDVGSPEDEDRPADADGDTRVDAGDSKMPDESQVPFGLPVLAEVPQLAALLEQVTVADGAMLNAVAQLADLLDSDLVETATGVGVDVLVGHLADALDELDPDDLTQREQDAAANRFLALQPRLDWTGGRFVGDLDAPGLALLDSATVPTAAQVDHAGGHGAARADLLLARLARSCPHAGDGACRHDEPHGHGTAADAPGASDREIATARGAGSDRTGDAAGAGSDHTSKPTSASWRDRLTPPKLLVRLPFDALVDPAVPAELLTRMTGGRLRLTSAAARRLLDERGALLRTIVVDDDGTVLGVGRTSRQPPRWLSDAALAVHDTCTGPGCDRPARSCQFDHATPWWPTSPDGPFGTTDIDNLGPLCAATNRAKEAAGWTTVQTAAGTRTWRHTRSGLTTTTVPSTWRPTGDPRNHHRHHRYRRRPVGTDPPEHDRSGPDGPGSNPRPAGQSDPAGPPHRDAGPPAPPADGADDPF